MRFSLKWLLAGMMYGAIAAAAFTRNSWHYADALWAIGFLAFGYAALVTYLARNERQARALGFAIFCALYAACAHFAPASLPTTRWVIATLPSQSDSGGVRVSSAEQLMSAPALGWNPFFSGSDGMLSLYLDMDALGKRLRAANAVATMLAGLIGCLLGAVAYRRRHSEE